MLNLLTPAALAALNGKAAGTLPLLRAGNAAPSALVAQLSLAPAGQNFVVLGNYSFGANKGIATVVDDADVVTIAFTYANGSQAAVRLQYLALGGLRGQAQLTFVAPQGPPCAAAPTPLASAFSRVSPPRLALRSVAGAGGRRLDAVRRAGVVGAVCRSVDSSTSGARALSSRAHTTRF